MSQYLKDPDYLFNLLAALVKKNDGELRITKEELNDVSKGDFIGMYFEPKTGAVILKEVATKDMLQVASLAREEDGVYDN